MSSELRWWQKEHTFGNDGTVRNDRIRRQAVENKSDWSSDQTNPTQLLCF